MTEPSVVIVIPCSSLNDYVMECLCECLQLDYGNCRIVLLPDHPVPLPEEFSSNVLIRPTGDVTIAAKRNTAIRAFPDADYYALIDSDAYPCRDWLKNGIRSFASSGAWAVGGPNLSPPGEPLIQKAVGNAARSIMVSGNMAFSKMKGISRFCENLHSCNLILSQQALKAAGLFDEAMITGEDRELCHRIRRQGGAIFFDGSVMVYHHNRRSGPHFFAQRFVHGYSIYAIAAADRSRGNIILFMPLLASVVGIALFIGGFIDRAAWMFCVATLCFYFFSAVVESVRHSCAVREIPLTLTAIITSNIAYLSGSIAWLFGATIDFKRLYRNHPGSGGA